MATLVKPEDYDKLRRAGEINALVLTTMREAIRPGMTSQELDDIACQIQEEHGADAPFLGYPEGGKHPYPARINVSINDELVHGIPSPDRVIQQGDIVTLDCGTSYQGLIADSAITVAVGKVPKKYHKLIKATEQALAAGIDAAQVGNKVGDIAASIQHVLRRHKVSIPPQYGGHSVGYTLHGSPHIPNWGAAGRGETLREGMALAIEPMGMYGNANTKLLRDHWTVVTIDGSICAHTEHTVLLTEDGTEVLTKLS